MHHINPTACGLTRVELLPETQGSGNANPPIRQYHPSHPMPSCQLTSFAPHPGPVSQVSEDCLSVYVDGSESGGAAAVSVDFLYAGVRATLSVRVWFPSIPVNVRVEDPTLNAVRGWGCKGVTRYQHSRVFVSTVLRAGENVSPEFDFSREARIFLSSSESSVVDVAIVEGESHHAVAMGRKPGTASILLTVEGREMGRADVEVTDTSVIATRLDLTPVAGLLVEASVFGEADGVDGFDLADVTTRIDPGLDSIGSRAFMHAAVLFSDGHDMTVAPSTGLKVASDDRNVAIVDGAIVAVVGSGTASLVAAWQGDVCDGSRTPQIVVAAAAIELSITAPPVVAVVITLSTSTLTTAGSLASELDASAGVATVAEMRIVSVDAAGTEVNIVNDPRLVIGGSGFRAERTSSTTMRLTLESDAAEVVTVTAALRDTALRTSATVTNVQVTLLSLEVLPYPAYPGSARSPVRRLRRYTAGQWQAAQLAVTVHLSHGQHVPVTLAAEVASSNAAVLAAEAGNPILQVTGLSEDMDGDTVVVLTASFHGRDSDPLAITVSPDIVALTAVGITLPSTLRGVAGTEVRRGQMSYCTPVALGPGRSLGRGITTFTRHTLTLITQIVFQVFPDVKLGFEDGTTVVDAFAHGSTTFAGLLVFASTAVAVDVDATTGALTLRGNSRVSGTLVATPVAPSAAAAAKADFVVNLMAAAGDVDVGNSLGLAVPEIALGSDFVLPLATTAPEGGVRELVLALAFDTDVMQFRGINPSGDFAQGDLLKVVATGPGAYEVTYTPEQHVGGSAVFAAAAFTAIKAGQGAVVARVIKYTNGAGVTAAPSAAVAGSVVVSVVDKSTPTEAVDPGRRRREAVDASIAPAILEVPECVAPPCAACASGGRPLGDANFDCLHDSQDALYVLAALAERMLAGGAFTQGLAQLDMMDADGDSEVNVADSAFLQRVDAKLLRFVDRVAVADVSADTGCRVELLVHVSYANGKPAEEADTAIFFTLESLAGLHESIVDAAGVTEGTEVARSATAPGRAAIVLRATYRDGGIFAAQLVSSAPVADIGVTVVQVTQGAPEPTAASIDGGMALDDPNNLALQVFTTTSTPPLAEEQGSSARKHHHMGSPNAPFRFATGFADLQSVADPYNGNAALLARLQGTRPRPCTGCVNTLQARPLPPFSLSNRSSFMLP